MADQDQKFNKIVLVVEDDIEFTKIITTKLNKENVGTLTAKTASEAWDILQNNKVDLVWVDHYLIGDETGYDLVAKIKSDNKLKRLPIFVVTNFDDYGNTVVFLERMISEDQPKTYLEFGIDKYYVKSNTSLDTIITDMKKTLKV